MAIFGKKQKTEAPKTQAAAAPKETRATASAKKHSGAVLVAPRVTEKSTIVAEQGVYVFDVAKDAGKREIAQAVHALFKVMPQKVRMVPVRGKVRRSRTTNRLGRSASGKKAYVYLKKGDTIELA